MRCFGGLLLAFIGGFSVYVVMSRLPDESYGQWAVPGAVIVFALVYYSYEIWMGKKQKQHPLQYKTLISIPLILLLICGVSALVTSVELSPQAETLVWLILPAATLGMAGIVLRGWLRTRHELPLLEQRRIAFRIGILVVVAVYMGLVITGIL